MPADHARAGYLGNEAATRSTLVAGGWLRTGDLAVVEANGYLRVVDRCKDMVRARARQYCCRRAARVARMPLAGERQGSATPP